MASFVIPSIFTAIDKLSGPVSKMSAKMDAFASRAEAGLARHERAFRKVMPVLGDATSQLLSFISTAAIAGAVIGGIMFTGAQIVSFDSAEKSFRTIVSDLNDAEFSTYKKEMFEVANATKRSSVDVAKNFEVIAGLNAEYAKTAEGLGAVSKATIVLARASNSELADSATNLVGIMNQYGAAANEADRYINVLAAGQAIGAASINQLSESFVNVGSTLKGANVTVEQGTALLEVLAGKGLLGAEAGTKLRGSILKLQQSGLGYKSGLFNINDAMQETVKKLGHLRTAKEKDAYLSKVFGAENISTGRILLDNVGSIQQFTTAVTGTSEAQRAADINSQSLANKLEDLKGKWVTVVTGSDKTSAALAGVSAAITFVTDNLESIIYYGGMILTFFGGWWALIQTGQMVLKTYNGVVKAVEVAQWAWNAAMSANPIGLVILAIAALIVIIAIVVSKVRGWGEQWDEIMRWMGAVFDTWKLHLTLQWKALEHVFMYFVESLVLAWKWGQNLIGNLSDAQYEKDKARIMAERKLRIDSIRETAVAYQKAAQSAMELPAWKLRWENDQDKQVDDWQENNTPYPQRTVPVLNTRSAENDNVVERMMSVQKQQTEITIKDETGRASVTGNQGAKTTPIKLTPTLGR